MKTVDLKDEETKVIDLGNSQGISASNVSNQTVKFYVDYESSPGNWSPVFGEITIRAGDPPFVKSKKDIGHEKIRVGAKGKDDDTVIVKVTY